MTVFAPNGIFGLDYKEGDWTPGLLIGGSSSGITLTSSGAYTKIGRCVVANFIITLSSKGSSTGSVKISGLPFSVADTLSGTANGASGSISYYGGLIADSVHMGVFSIEGGNNLQLTNVASASTRTATDLQNTDIGNTFTVRGSITYFA